MPAAAAARRAAEPVGEVHGVECARVGPVLMLLIDEASTSGPTSACRSPRPPRTAPRSTRYAASSTCSPPWSAPAGRTGWSARLDHDWRPAWRVARCRRTRRTGSPRGRRDRAGHPGAAGAGDPGGARRVGIAAVGATGYEADDVLGTLVTPDRRRSRWSAATATCSRWSTTPHRCTCSTSARAWRNLDEMRRLRGRGQYGVPGAGTPTSPCCAATRATGCPGSRASGRSRPPRW